MLIRSWLTFAVVIAVVQAALASLSVLQHDAIYSELLRKRMSVMAQTVAASFKPFTDLGLPLAMARNGSELLARPIAIDPEIEAVHAISPLGTVEHSTADPKPQSVPQPVLTAMELSDGPTWSVETAEHLYSGNAVTGLTGPAGAIVVVFPKARLEAASKALRWRAFQYALAIWAAFSAAAVVLLRLMLAAPVRALAALADSTGPPSSREAAVHGRLFGEAIDRLSADLAEAEKAYEQAEWSLAALTGREGEAALPLPVRQNEPDANAENDTLAGPTSGRPLAHRLANRVELASALFAIGSALVFGTLILQEVNRSIAPEFVGRTNLIGTVVSDNVQRAVEAGLPIDRLVGAEQYFGDMLQQLPEVAYIAVATDTIVLKAGKQPGPSSVTRGDLEDQRSHPIVHDGEEIAHVVIGIDPAFVAKSFQDVFLDIGVVLLVAVFLAREITMLLTSRTMTAALDRLQRVVTQQAAGDFSVRVLANARSAVDRMTNRLAERADRLRGLYQQALTAFAAAGRDTSSLRAFGERHHLDPGRAEMPRVSHFTDIRLPLFLFAAADQLPLSFLPIFTRAAGNPFPWLDESVVISLPLAGYLLAILIATPYVRRLAERFGLRRIMIVAAVPSVVAQIGLFLATTVGEIVLWRTVTGFGYALVTLSCQDYLIDATPERERYRSLGMYSAVLFVGIFCGAALGGVLADRFGQANVFLLSALLVVLSAALIFRLIGADTERRSAEATDWRQILVTLANHRFAALVFGIATPMNIVLQAFVSYLVALTLNSLGASSADIGRALMLYFLGVAALGSQAGRLSEAGLRAPVAAFGGQIVAGAALIPAALWPSQFSVIGAMIGAGLGHGLVRSAEVSIAVTLASEDTGFNRSSALSALRTMERGGSILGLLAIAAVTGFVGYGGAIATVAATALVGAVLYFPFIFKDTGREDIR